MTRRRKTFVPFRLMVVGLVLTSLPGFARAQDKATPYHRTLLRGNSSGASVSAATTLATTSTQATSQVARHPGTSTVCDDFSIAVDLLLVDIKIPFTERPDEGWAWVEPQGRRLRSATGYVSDVRMAATDTPANHDSHDVDFQLNVDLGQEYLMTGIQASLGIEWESGMDALRDQRGEGLRTFPKWVWPSEGDRAWVDGHWILDCGHPDKRVEPWRYHAEIHPPRAVASMRDQAAPLPGTGTTPVPVTLTDVFISGRGGYVVQMLNCGPDIILGEHGDTCGQSTPPPDFEAKKTTPINDTNFTFDVCLPPQPPKSVFSSRVELGPGNTVNIDPILRKVAAQGACATADEFGNYRYDPKWMMNVTIPLNGTDTPPTAVYGRRIYAGWIAAPDPVLPHRTLALNRLHLHDDGDFGQPGQLAFWFMNVGPSPWAWLRLSDFTDGMDWFGGYVDDDAERKFNGMSFDYYLRNVPNDRYWVRSRAYEQDCYDHRLWLDGHFLNPGGYGECLLQFHDWADNDVVRNADRQFTQDEFGPNFKMSGGSQYDMYFSIEEVPVADEDTADLGVGSITCTPAGEVALVGKPLTCNARLTNGGAGIPRLAAATTTFGDNRAAVESGTWTFAFPFTEFVHERCDASGAQVACDVATVPAPTGVDLAIHAKPTAAGLLTATTTVTTQSTDPVATNNSNSTTVDVFKSVTLDVEPGDPTNVVELNRRGLITVAVLTTSDFDAASVDPATVCFGDARTPTERSCTEVHGRAHLIDVNRDRTPDMVFHFDVDATGISMGDTEACLKGRTTGNIGIYGCDAVAPRDQ
jgi:hypothetical protein